ncbi:methyl-accepting chemotaxis protein [Pseudoalteromonas luteoviolacea]|uniref:methyl-accepting chemotaxis protein n=1 Tax=Pseudoalteromonas luteoviolacea TaxID=43657 RepID=UPI001EEEAD5C|nr:methyl-accepting chemotaxis protein [Pseudoalteromonas luteoviolacea]MCF6441660.1 methyl-accepting chemotaxis protein [Pseudoalteromonas luteoviolacea]
MSRIHQFLKSLDLAKKLMAAFLLVALIPATVIIAFSLIQASNTISEQVYAQLGAVGKVKKRAIERHFKTVEDKLRALAINPYLIQATQDLLDGFDETQATQSIPSNLQQFYQDAFLPRFEQQTNSKVALNSLLDSLSGQGMTLQARYLADNPHPIGEKDALNATGHLDAYDLAHQRHHEFFREITDVYQLYDIFIVDNYSGNIVYSVFKEVDFATSLSTGPYANSSIADVFNRALIEQDQMLFADYEPYLPSYNAPASFVAMPLDFDGISQATLIFQLSIDALNDIMSERHGLGESGETYLVGPDGLMRSDSYLDPINHSVVASFANPDKGTIATESYQLAMQGQQGQKVVTDYNGNPVLSAYSDLQVFDVRWALLAEIDEAEAFAPVGALRQTMAIVMLVSIGVILLTAVWFARSLARPVHNLVNTMREVQTRGDFSLRADVSSRDEIGQSAQAFNSLLDALQLSISEANRVLNQMAKGTFNDRISVPCNGELKELKEATNECSSSLQTALAEINLVMQAMAKGRFNQQITAPLSGDLDMLKTNINRSVISIDDTMNDIVNVMSCVEKGEFKQQVTVEARGSLARLKDSVNNSIQALSGAIDELSLTMSAISNGDFSKRITHPLSGQLAQLKHDTNLSMDNLEAILKDIGNTMAAVSEGDFKHPIEASAHGQLGQLKANVNLSIASLDQAISEISSVMMAISHGRFDRTIQTPLKGQLATLQNDINHTVNNLSQVVEELASVMAAMSEGDFSHKIESSLQGQLLQLKEDVNSSIDTISTAIHAVTDSLSAIARGDLCTSVQGHYQGVFATLQQDVHTTTHKLTHVIESIQSAASLVAHSTEEIAASNAEISRRTEEQAANLEEANASTGHILEELTQVALQSETAVEKSHNAECIAKEGGTLSQDTVHAIGEVNAASKDINEIVSVIDELAFQTNLLALNAAVEAARAGEHGRGFAVVANEVRELAGRSASSAKQIKEIIANSNDKVQQGTTLANSSGEKLEHIVQAVADVNQNIVSINRSTLTQKQAIAEVDVVVQRLTDLIQENSAITEETMAAAKRMAAQAMEMKNLLGYFTLPDDEHGQSTEVATPQQALLVHQYNV